MDWDDAKARGFLQDLFTAAIQAADPRAVLARYLPPRPEKGRILVLGTGKSAALMAAAVEEAWPDAALSGLVVTRYGHAFPTRRIEVVEASHPVPDAAGAAAARRMLDLTESLTADDLVLVLISGGGSALLALPAEGLTLEDKQAVNRALLASGATINEMNCVRRHLSAIKGGRLAAACAPARVVTLAISDVPGDDPAVIASGPTVPDPTTFADARALVAHYGITLPPAVAQHLHDARDETPKPGDPRLARAEYHMIATPLMALQAMAAAAKAQGVTPLILGDALEGEAAELGIALGGIAKSVAAHALPVAAPAVLLSGGETTVTIRAGQKAGAGGRNTECLLGLALTLAGHAGIWAMAADTDGIDGTEDAAGAVIGPDTLERAKGLGMDPRAVLAGHDSYTLFRRLDATLITGPTLTNVNDVRALLITA